MLIAAISRIAAIRFFCSQEVLGTPHLLPSWWQCLTALVACRTMTWVKTLCCRATCKATPSVEGLPAVMVDVACRSEPCRPVPMQCSLQFHLVPRLAGAAGCSQDVLLVSHSYTAVKTYRAPPAHLDALGGISMLSSVNIFDPHRTQDADCKQWNMKWDSKQFFSTSVFWLVVLIIWIMKNYLLTHFTVLTHNMLKTVIQVINARAFKHC